MEIKVLTYNIHHGRDPYGKSSLPGLVEFFSQAKPQVICLNEVDVHNPRSGLIDQPHWLAGQLGMSAAFGPTLKFCCLGYGNAVLSSFPMRILGNHRLYSSREPRCALETEILTPRGPLTIICTHLGLTILERERQVQEILQKVKLNSGRPIILAGDANASAHELEPLFARLQDTVAIQEVKMAGTFPVSEPKKRIDYILCSRHFTVLQQVCPKVDYSDHLPVIATLELN